MDLEIYWLEFAENKLEDIYSYYSEIAGKRIAEQIVIGIIETTNDLEKNPETGQKEIYLAKRKENFRYLLFKNYKIIYWINCHFGRVEIANIFDTRQDPHKIKDTE